MTMIGLDTNVLARYYIEDRKDAESARQRVVARRLIDSGKPLMVCKTVILELEWVMRGYYGFTSAEVISVLRHLIAIPHVSSPTAKSFAARSPRPPRYCLRGTSPGPMSQASTGWRLSSGHWASGTVL